MEDELPHFESYEAHRSLPLVKRNGKYVPKGEAYIHRFSETPDMLYAPIISKGEYTKDPIIQLLRDRYCSLPVYFNARYK